MPPLNIRLKNVAVPLLVRYYFKRQTLPCNCSPDSQRAIFPLKNAHLWLSISMVKNTKHPQAISTKEMANCFQLPQPASTRRMWMALQECKGHWTQLWSCPFAPKLAAALPAQGWRLALGARQPRTPLGALAAVRLLRSAFSSPFYTPRGALTRLKLRELHTLGFLVGTTSASFS